MVRPPAVVATTLVWIAVAVAAALHLGTTARRFNHDLALARPPLAAAPPLLLPPAGPRLSARVYLVVVDGLRVDHSRLPFFDRLRARGVDAIAGVHYPTWSRPSYVAMLTGVPPPASGVRTNRVPWPVPLDSVMERARAAGLRVGSASDIGGVPSLFVRPADVALAELRFSQTGDRAAPPNGSTWPFDDVRVGEHADTLEPAIANVLAGRPDFVLVVAGDVDRAGHAYGATSQAYRDAAATVDAALGRALANIDLEHETIVLTADHGHVDRGGHGGLEPEVTSVPLILAGAGIVRGARIDDAHLADLAPTIAALLGIPAPGHGVGRTLHEVLAIPPEVAAELAARDTRRRAANAAVLDEVSDPPDILQLLLVAACAVGACLLAGLARRRGALVRPRGVQTIVAMLGFAVVVVGLVAICGGHLSPSQVPMLYRLERFLAVAFLGGIALQLAAGLAALRRTVGEERLAHANGIAIVGLFATLTPVFAVTAWFAPPYLEVPGPGWLVAIPAGQLAATCGASATALALVIELARHAWRGRAT